MINTIAELQGSLDDSKARIILRVYNAVKDDPDARDSFEQWASAFDSLDPSFEEKFAVLKFFLPKTL